MSNAARGGLLAAAAIVAVIAFVVLRPGSDDPDPLASRDAVTATTRAQATTPAEPKPSVPVLRPSKPRTLRFESGETIRFSVVSDAADEIHVHGYDRSKEVSAGRRVTMSFKATIEGIFEIELEQSGRELGTLEVSPS